MKYLLSAALFFLSVGLLARTPDCYSYLQQDEKNKCMSFERDKSVARLMTAIGAYCAEQTKIKKSRGKKIHAMLVDECIARELEGLAVYVELGDR